MTGLSGTLRRHPFDCTEPPPRSTVFIEVYRASIISSIGIELDCKELLPCCTSAQDSNIQILYIESIDPFRYPDSDCDQLKSLDLNPAESSP